MSKGRKETEMDFNKEFNWCDEDVTLADWYNCMVSRVAWRLFDEQGEWLYLFGELEKGSKPRIKSQRAFEVAFDKAWAENINVMRATTFYGLLKMYADGDVEVPETLAWDYNDYMGFEDGEDGRMKGYENE